MAKRVKLEAIHAKDCMILRCSTAMVLAIYIDNVIFFTSNKEEVIFIKKQITAKFDIKDHGDTTLIFGFWVTWDQDMQTLRLDQSIYIEKILRKYKIAKCIPVTTPVERYWALKLAWLEEKRLDQIKYQYCLSSIN